MDAGWIQTVFREFLELQRQAQDSLSQAFLSTTGSGDIREAALLMLLAAVFGAIHAIGPGHGKSVIVSYFVSREARMAHGLLASVKLIATHVGTAIVLVLFAVFIAEVSFGLRPADFPVVRQVSYAGIVLVGLFLVFQSCRAATAHSHPTAGGLLPYLAGLSPCPLTTIIMLASVGAGALVLGLAVSVSMALGMVLTVTLFAVAAIVARKWLCVALDRHTAKIFRVSRALEFLGALAVTGIGALLFVSELA